MRDKTKKRRTRAKRTSPNEMIGRVQTVKKRLLEGATRQEILAECLDRWGIGERQATEYLGRAREEIALETEAAAIATYEWHVLMRLDLVRRANATDDTGKALKVLQDLAQFQGLDHGAGAGHVTGDAIEEALRQFFPEMKGE